MLLRICIPYVFMFQLGTALRLQCDISIRVKTMVAGVVEYPLSGFFKVCKHSFKSYTLEL